MELLIISADNGYKSLKFRRANMIKFKKSFQILFFITSFLFATIQVYLACEGDSDCRKGRICEDGRCVKDTTEDPSILYCCISGQRMCTDNITYQKPSEEINKRCQCNTAYGLQDGKVCR